MNSNYPSVNLPPAGVVFLTTPLHPMADPASDKDSVSTESTLQDSSCTEEGPEDGVWTVLCMFRPFDNLRALVFRRT